MDREPSSYYPPRASERWISPRSGQAIDRAWLALRRAFFRSPLGAEAFLSLSGIDLLLCLLVPGRGYSILGHHLLGRLFLGGWAVCGLMAFAFLPSELMLGWAIGGMASCHASGVGFLLLRQVEDAEGSPPRLHLRIAVPFVCWLAFAALVYWPGFGLVRRNLANPLRITVEDRTVVFNPRARPGDVHRGDLVAFHSPGFSIGGNGQIPVRAAEGPMLGRVVGLPGDRVEFTPKSVRVNGRAGPRESTMPLEGTVVVEKGAWMVWPTVRLRVNNAGGQDTASITAAFLMISRVPQGDFLGRAYDRWFFRRQDLQ